MTKKNISKKTVFKSKVYLVYQRQNGIYIDKAVTDALEVFNLPLHPLKKPNNNNNNKKRQRQPITSVSSLFIKFTEGVLGKFSRRHNLFLNILLLASLLKT